MPKGLNRRRIVVVDPRLQYRYLLLPLIVTATTAASLFALFLVQANALLPQGTEADAELVDYIGTLQLYTAVVVGAVLVLHVVVVVLLGLIMSLKVAGPISRFKKIMSEVAQGNINARVSLRDGDQFTDMADTFNEMMDTLSAKIKANEPQEEVEQLLGPEI